MALVATLVLGFAVFVVVVDAVRRAQSPRADEDHWHMVYGVYLCDRYLAPLQGDEDRAGIHSHGDGIVHVEPTGPTSAGWNATFARFEEAHGLEITLSSLRWTDGTVPVQAEVRNGCGGKPAEVVTFLDGLRAHGTPGDFRLRDLRVMVPALVPKGTTYAEIGPPPSMRNLAAVSAGRVP